MAKTELDVALERNPLEFMKTHSVFPQDYTGHNPGIFNKPNSDTKGGAALDETLVVERRARQIAYTKIAPVVDPQNQQSQGNTYNLFFETGATIGTKAADHIACWFLPWASNHLTMIQRPPKIPTRLGGAPSSAVDPDLFFTAAISGCSVMVAGDAKSPFVTHGGTRTARSKTSDENALPQGCVFGVRDGAGSWSFYLQKTVTFSFTRLRKKKGFLSSSYVPANASLPPSQVKAILESYL